MSGCIDLTYPFVNSWLWETSEKEVVMSMIIVDKTERRKGHCRGLIHRLKQKYDTILVPVPSDALRALLIDEGFDKGTEKEGTYCLMWTKEE